jgi:hypothetical protein
LRHKRLQKSSASVQDLFKAKCDRMSSKANVLRAYKNLLKMARKLPDSKRRDATYNDIKSEFRRNHDEVDPLRIEEMLLKAQSSLGYLKIVTPKIRTAGQAGITKIVYGSSDGKVSKAVSNWTGNNLDPDQVKRHYRSLNRAGFKNNADAKGIF